MSTLTINNYTLEIFDLGAKDKMNKYLKLINVDLSDYTFLAIIFGYQLQLDFIRL